MVSRGEWSEEMATAMAMATPATGTRKSTRRGCYTQECLLGEKRTKEEILQDLEILAALAESSEQ